MGGINRNPSGLLNFLLTQAGGRNPDFLLEQVRPVLDIEKYYEPDRLRAVSEVISLNVGQLDFIEVPESEVWLVKSVGVVIDNGLGLAANNIINFSVWHERIPGQGFNGVPFVDLQTPRTTQTIVGRYVSAKEIVTPRIVSSGQRLVISYDSGDAEPCGGDFFVTFVQLQTPNP